METITNKTLEKLKYELVRDGIVSYETLEKAEELANVQRINIGQALINSGILAEDTLLKFLETKLHIPYVNLEDYEPDTRCFKFVTFADARRYRIIPLFKIEDVLTVAMAIRWICLRLIRLLKQLNVQLNRLLHLKQVLLKRLMSITKLLILLTA